MIRQLLRPVVRKFRPRPQATPHVMTEDLQSRNVVGASATGVSAVVHPDDHLYWYGIDNFGIERGCPGYFTDGAECAAKLDALVEPGPKSMLEFASGYGRVTRHLSSRFRVTACDIHPQAVEFVSRVLGIPAIPSTERPEDFAAPPHDVVFALSFFSHLPRRTFGAWLRALFSVVAPGGRLIFTTHGMKARKVLPPLTDGFWFDPASDQPDLDSASYGTAITSPEYVIREIYTQTRSPIVSFTEAGYWSCQDIWVVQKS